MDTNLMVLLENSQIVTDASNPTGDSNIDISLLGNGELVILQSLNSTIRAAGDLMIDSSVTLDPVDMQEVVVVDPNALIAQDPCRRGRDSEFIVTGRGGLPPSPRDFQSVSLARVKLIEIREDSSQGLGDAQTNHHQPQRTSQDIIPARGWIRNEKGEVILVSYNSTRSGGQRLQYHSDLCQH
ncbi:MAG: hypothetical protein ACFBSC_16065 [Microcoleaceae cyanobacterium]